MVLGRLLVLGLVAWSVAPLGAAGPTAATTAAFDRYIRATEARIASEVTDERRFLRIDMQEATTRQAWLGQLRSGQVVVERLQSRDNGARIEVPDAMVHHWTGLAFIPGATTRMALTLLRDYDRHAEIYQPAVQRARVIERSGNRFRVFIRFFMRKIVSVTLDSDHEAQFTEQSATRAYSRVVSTRVQEVRDAGSANERLAPIGDDTGYLWRINSYWRFLEREGGVYIQCESVSLTRDIPTGLGWVVGPFVTSLPKESLEFTMASTRRALAASVVPQMGPTRPPKTP
jgi:hypothetical protein